MSTFNITNIESTSGEAPNFSQGLNVGGSSITSLITMTEYYSQAGTPPTPANGAVWWDYTNAYQYVGGSWRILSVTLPPAWFGDRGVIAGGLGTNGIDYITISTPGNASSFGTTLSSTQSYAMAGTSNGSRGVFGGVYGDSTIENTIQYLTFATLGNTVDFGDLTVARAYCSACSDGTYGVFSGGNNASFTRLNTIDYVTIGTTSNATDFGDLLSAAKASVAAWSNGTRGVLGGGVDVNSTRVNNIDYITIAVPSNTTDFGDLTAARDALACGGNTTYALWGGGSTGSVTNIIDYVTISTTGNATDFGDLTAARSNLTAVSNVVRSAFAGGFTTFNSNIIDYVTTATPSNATDFGDLTVEKRLLGGASGD